MAVKLLIVGGGLYRLSHPPRFVSAMTGSKTDVIDSLQKGKSASMDMYRVLTFKDKRLGPVKGLLGKIFKKKATT